MPGLDADHDLRYGVLALEMELIGRDELVEAMHAWALAGARPLGEILRERGALSEDEHARIEALVENQTQRQAETARWPVPTAGLGHSCGSGHVSTVSDGGATGDAAGPEGSMEVTSRGADAPRFRKLRPHGKGGLGEVTVALDLELNREVALKEIRPKHAGDEASRARFVVEAEVTGSLEHPGVVPVYGLGYHPDGRPFYAMRLIKGESLKAAIARLHGDGRAAGHAPRRWAGELRSLLRRLIDACNAVAYAHSRGILHRDLKPANIMLGPFRETLVVDWGLAKAMGRPEEGGVGEAEPRLKPSLAGGSTETLIGSAVGTPGYMSPEQAAGRLDRVGPASDVYSLGATLYCLLTGRRPFTDPDRDEIIQKVQRGDFPAPRALDARIPAGLEAICLKAMAAEPEDRYASPLDLADDLERWLADEPVDVYREPLSTRLTRWGRRHRTAAVAIGTLLVTVAMASALGAILIGRARAETERQHDQALANLSEVRRQQTALRRQDYVTKVNLAARELQDNDVSLAQRLLDACPTPLRGWEWDYIRRSCHLEAMTYRGHSANVFDAAFSADGRRILSGSGGYPYPRPGEPGDLTLWETTTGRVVKRFRGPRNGVTAVASSPDGRRVAAGTGYYARSSQGTTSERADLTVWDVATGRVLWSRPVANHLVLSAAFSPDGRRLAMGCGLYNDTGPAPGSFSVLDAESGDEILAIPGLPGTIDCGVAFSPDSKRLAVAAAKVAQIWDLETRGKISVFEGHGEWVGAVAFSPDGERVATAGGDRVIRLWEAASGREVRALAGHTGSIRAVAFSPDGKLLASAGEDRVARLWDATTGGEVAVFRGHVDIVNGLAFRPDGTQLATTSRDGTVKVWDVAGSRPAILDVGNGWTFGLAFSPDGRLIATGSGYHGDSTVTLWDAATRRRTHVLKGHLMTVWGVAFSPDGTRLASASDDQTIKVWDVASGREDLTLRGHSQGIVCVAFSPDGREIASSSGDQTVRIWDAATGRERIALRANEYNVWGVAFSPDGTRLVSTHGSWIEEPGRVLIWDVRTGRELRRFRAHLHGAHGVRFSPDGTRLATAGIDRSARAVGEVRIWDLATGRECLHIAGHTDVPSDLAYSPDGTRLATAGLDGTVKIWDAATGEAMLTLRGRSSSALSVAFSPDGRRLAAGGIDGSTQIWDATPIPEGVPTP